MFKVTTVANTILKKCRDKGIELTHLKLQKLIFLASQEYAKETNEYLVAEHFGVWKYGPALEGLYQLAKKYGSEVIPDDEYFETINEQKNAIVVSIVGDNETKALAAIDNAIEEYAQLSASELVNLTHKKNAAWRLAQKAGRNFILLDHMINACEFNAEVASG
jgi:uncharacterized phage-associated protein